MKNKSNICLLLAFSAALFYGCGSSKSFSDKHYNNRYYIGMSKKEKVRDNEPVSDHNIITAANEDIIALEQTASVMAGKTETVLTSDSKLSMDEFEVVKYQTDSEPVSIKNENNQFSEQSAEEKRTNFVMNEFPSLITKKISNKKVEFTHASPERDALSLLWIVIVILLILWIIGWLVGGFGLGGFIHLVALVALILLILWLFRII